MIYHCQGCTKRYPGCHDVCEDYFEDTEKNNKKKEKIRKQKEDDERSLRTPKKKQKSRW